MIKKPAGRFIIASSTSNNEKGTHRDTRGDLIIGRGREWIHKATLPGRSPDQS